MKNLVVHMSDQTVWKIPAKVIAENRAKYYADIDSKQGEEFDTVYKEELDLTMQNNTMLIEWAENNMNWLDVKQLAKLVGQVPINYESDWVNAVKTIIDEEDSNGSAS